MANGNGAAGGGRKQKAKIKKPLSRVNFRLQNFLVSL